MTLDLSTLPERRRRPIVERYQRETVAMLASAMYPDYLAAHGTEGALDEIRAALLADGFPTKVATVRFIRAAIREGR